MVYRTVICVLLVGFVGVALGCDRPESVELTPTNRAPASLPSPTVNSTPLAIVTAVPVAEQPAPSPTPTPPIETIEEPAKVTSGSVAYAPPQDFPGEMTLEQRIIDHPTIVKAQLSSITGETMQIMDSTRPSIHEKYFIVLKFNLAVVEYLQGTGDSNIVAVWVSRGFDTDAEAVAAIPTELSSRDDQWDDREAIFFLDGEPENYLFPSSLRMAGYYLLSTGYGHGFDDTYTIRSQSLKTWLPAAVPNSPASESQEFLLAAPEPGSSLSPPTITLGDMKRLIAEVYAELNGGDGSQTHKDCVRFKYKDERVNRWRASEGTTQKYEPEFNGMFLSGQSAGVVLYEFDLGGAINADKRARHWLDGQDAALFASKIGELRPLGDRDGDGQSDGFVFDQSVVSARPIPSGSYKFNNNFTPFRYLVCGHTFTYEVSVVVTAPAGVLHELFFDPVTVGSGVTADAANGVLKPASFTDANGGSATIGSISFESGSVEVEVTPDDALDDHILDIIELDGTVSLSLDVVDAAVDRANDTLSWSVASQPWEDGDLLMVRIREASP